MINSDLIQTLVIDRPNLRMNNREKVIDGDSLWRPTEAAKTRFLNVFKTFLPRNGLMEKNCLRQLEALINSFTFY